MIQQINAITPLEEARAALADAFELKFTKAVEKATQPVFDKVKDRIPEIEWPFYAPLIFEINRLKKKKNAAILAHNYQTPQIYYGVADIVGDSLQLAIEATRVEADTIVQCGVHFMAETSKMLNPEKTVLIPDSRAGCSLASSITAEDVLAMRAQYPGVPVVTYVNSSAAVKAVTDVCCTSSNALEIVEAVEGDTVLMIPDQYLAQNTAKKTKKKIITWAGACEVHETFTADDIAELRAAYPGAKIIAHPECPPEVIDNVDFAGSTSGMIDWIKTQKPPKVVMVTECSMSDNVAAETEGVSFLRGCNICPHMKRINLENVLWSLHTGTEEVTIPEELIEPARASVERMIEISTRKKH
ncbi:quinolinate synthase NadA [Pelagibacterium xiamenense]|uniref:quinolinate synthase NadA n=1 Tax=Pelagibacterium xiamenense TaxID=2901140 RepID=UPI001E36C34D|nr:quinolinate synthase NadA [Pelagibacterium xiamenense]MCD7060556.1 quinolinate synthase NadA [Pelagibacterium xiamenense]